MHEFLAKLLGIGSPSETRGLISQQHGLNAFNPLTDPDLARRIDIASTPGVIRGSHRWETEDGVCEIDFDKRDEFGNPTRKFYPKV